MLVTIMLCSTNGLPVGGVERWSLELKGAYHGAQVSSG